VSDINFDILALRANAADSTIEDKNQLFGLVFSLPEWNFIARGEFPNLHPYIAGNAEIAEGQDMVRAFTDTERLYRFAEENGLLTGNLESLTLSVPTENIVDYLEQFIQYGVYGIWFNSDSSSNGFFIPLRQLRPIKVHLTSNGWLV
jgi:hypothetical protein